MGKLIEHCAGIADEPIVLQSGWNDGGTIAIVGARELELELEDPLDRQRASAAGKAGNSFSYGQDVPTLRVLS